MESLITVGQTHAAQPVLQSFTEILLSKCFCKTPLASLEPTIIRFVELYVEVRNASCAKDQKVALRKGAPNIITSVGSIEVVIQKLVSLKSGKLQKAQGKTEKAAALADIDGLEATETPESLMLLVRPVRIGPI